MDHTGNKTFVCYPANMMCSKSNQKIKPPSGDLRYVTLEWSHWTRFDSSRTFLDSMDLLRDRRAGLSCGLSLIRRTKGPARFVTLPFVVPTDLYKRTLILLEYRYQLPAESTTNGNAIKQCACACIMAVRRCSAHADVE